MRGYRGRVYAFFAAFCLCATLAHAQSTERWVAFYGEAARSDQFDAYTVILFDSDAHPSIQPLKARGKTVIGYLSLGEAENFRPYFNDVKQRGLLLQANKQWKGHHVIDIRKPEWEALVLNKLLPGVMAQGFDGVMLDTIDSPIDLENRFPNKFPGMRQAAVKLISDIHARYPQAQIMLNRGFEILPAVATSISMSLAESTYSDTSQNGKIKRASKKDHQNAMRSLKQAQENNPNLKIYSLDYWNMKDKKGVAKIYAFQRAQGFIPYVSTASLQKIFPEPAL